MRKTKIKGFIINDFVMNLPEISEIINEEGAEGLGKFVALTCRLYSCDNAIGTMSDIKFVGQIIKVRPWKLKEWVRSHNIFSYDDENDMFVIPNVREILGLDKNMHEHEIEMIKKYGNKARKLTHEDGMKSDVSAVPDAQQNISRTSADAQQNVSRNSTEILESSENADNEDVNCSPIINSNNIKNINKNISYKNRNININIENNSDADDSKSTFKFFEEKIFNNKIWRDATALSHGINQNDDETTRIFAKWMFSYCISRSENKLHNVDDMFNYASNLLMKGHSTRKMFLDFLHEEQERRRRQREEERREREERECSSRASKAEFEQCINGRRIGVGGQILPDEAPRQTDFNSRWSYLEHRYVSAKVWNRNAEMAEFEVQRRKAQEEKLRKEKAEMEKRRKMRAAVEMLRKADAEYQMRKKLGLKDDDPLPRVGSIIENEILPKLKK